MIFLFNTKMAFYDKMLILKNQRAKNANNPNARKRRYH